MRTAYAAGLLLLAIGLGAPAARAGDPPTATAAPVPAPPTATAGPAASTPTAAPEGPTGPGPLPATLVAAIEGWVAQLRSEKQAVRDAAAAALVKVGKPAVDRLEAEAGRDESLLIRVRALLSQIEPDRDGPGPKAERWYEAKFREAARRVERGDNLGAVKMLDALLILEPDCPIRERFSALRQRAKELELRKSVIEARLVPKRVLLSPGEPIEVVIEVKNVSNAPLELAPPDSKEGGVFGALDIETIEALPSGQRGRRREVQRIDRAIQGVLRPGEVWRTTVRLNDDRPPPALGPDGVPLALAPTDAYRRVVVSGSMRSQVLVRRDERFDRFLPLFAVEVHIVDRVRQGLAADPRRSLADAIETLRRKPPEDEARRVAERLFYAAMLVPSSTREDAISLLGTTLERDLDPAAPAAMGALGALVDPPVEMDRTAWRAWLRKHAN